MIPQKGNTVKQDFFTLQSAGGAAAKATDLKTARRFIAIIISKVRRETDRIMKNSDLEIRPLSLDDAQSYVNTENAVSASIGVNERIGPEIVLLQWREPGFDLSDSSIAYVDANGLLAGYATFWATADKPVRPGVNWGVHPAYLEREIERELLAWADSKAREVIARCPPEARISLRSGARQGYSFAENALQKAGFSVSRSFYDMEIKLTAPPIRPPWPEGIVTRPYCHEADLPLLVDVVRDSFSDHFGFIEEPFEKDLELFRHWLDNDPYFEPELVIFPVDKTTGAVVGCLLGLTQDFRAAEAGYIDTVGVRRDYRRRGLASAMLQHSFAAFWERGKRLVHLDVDGQSLTNAVALYERVGMYVYQRYNVYEKVLREGVELAKVTP